MKREVKINVIDVNYECKKDAVEESDRDKILESIKFFEKVGGKLIQQTYLING